MLPVHSNILVVLNKAIAVVNSLIRMEHQNVLQCSSLTMPFEVQASHWLCLTTSGRMLGIGLLFMDLLS